jgi:alpha/beta superfamily hydrolase
MPPNESFALAGKAGSLEALLQLPEAPPIGAALVCHAHPLQGGMMHFKVVFRAAKVLQGAGFACLRFNFRGVGASEGRHDHGRGEQDDVRTGVAELERRFPGLPLVLGGFSFGAFMALSVGVPLPSVRALFALGFPLRSVPSTDFLKGVQKPLAFVQGERDAFGTGAEVNSLVSRLALRASLVVIPGSDHFFTGHEEAMQHALKDWLSGLPRL